MKQKKYDVVAAVLAGGLGRRMQKGNTLKQFLSLGKKTIIQKTIEAFKNSGIVSKVIIPLLRNFFTVYENEFKKYKFNEFVEIIEGGKERQISSYNALKHIESAGGAEIVIIHDAVRPFVTEKMIKDSVMLARQYGACETAVPAIDTLIRKDGEFLKEILPRKEIFYVQTPQTFKFDLILKAHDKAMQRGFVTATDDAQLILQLGKKVAILEGTYENIKITSPKDYELAKIINKNDRILQ